MFLFAFSALFWGSRISGEMKRSCYNGEGCCSCIESPAITNYRLEVAWDNSVFDVVEDVDDNYIIQHALDTQQSCVKSTNRNCRILTRMSGVWTIRKAHVAQVFSDLGRKNRSIPAIGRKYFINDQAMFTRFNLSCISLQNATRSSFCANVVHMRRRQRQSMAPPDLSQCA